MGADILWRIDGRRNKKSILVKVIGGDKYISLSFLSG
jgi:hypothetical protein